MSYAQESSQERATEFVPVEGGGDTASAGALLIVAYLIMWAVLVGFVLMTWRRQRSLEAKAGDLERRLSAAAGSNDRP